MAQYVIPQGRWHTLVPLQYGWEACKPGHTFGPAVREYYLLHYILEGEGEFVRDGKVYPLTKGDIFVIRPGEVTTYRASERNPWQYSWLGFRAPDSLPCLQTPVLSQPPVGHIFRFIRDHYTDDSLDGKIFSLTHELVWLLSQNREQPKGKPSSFAVYTKTYLESSYMHRVNIQEIANSLHIDRRYLTALFRKTYGKPPQTFLMALRLEKAREFLQKGHRVSEAAAMAGFTDLPNFTRHYKSRYGCNPSEDRA